MDERYALPSYTVRRKVFKLAGATFHVFDPSGAVVFYSKMKAFKLREDIRLFSGEDMQTELLHIGARRILDFAAAYDVTDATTNEKVGSLKRKGLKSIVRDHWIIMDTQDNEIGTVQEDSTGLAIMRRLLGAWGSIIAPQKYHFEIGGQPVAIGAQNRNPFVYKVTMDFSQDVGGVLDRRLGIAAGLLLAAIEGKQG